MKKILLFSSIVVVVIFGAILFFKKSANEPIILPNSDLIKVDSPSLNQVIQSPFTITGQARGTWFFEASFPVKLVDLSGNVIVQTFANAKGEWMTENFVPFESILNFDIATTTQPAILILQKDNPSGLPENDAQIEIPVILKQ